MRRLTRHWPWAVATAGIVANGIRLRSRVSRLAVLDESASLGLVDADGTVAPVAGGRWAGTLGLGTDGEYGLLVGAGVNVDPSIVQAAVRYARAGDLDVLDLVPGDLHTDRLYELIRQVDPATYRDDPLAIGRGAGHATLVRTGLLDLLGHARRRTLDPVQYVDMMVQLKRYAPTSSDLVVAPGLAAVELEDAWRLPRLRALDATAPPGYIALPLAQAGLMAVAPLLGGRKGAAALAAYSAQPYLVTAGGPVKPRDLRPATAALRAGHELAAVVRAVQAPAPHTVQHRADFQAREEETRRSQYARLIERQASFVEPPRATCPWCDSGELRQKLVIDDLLQGKPGRFRLDQCQDCRHVFQNPRLSIEGLDFYYRDFYDGLGYEDAAFMFSMGAKSYQGRAAMLQGVAEPKRWLDVGAGHGHFCLTAKQSWPETTFDALDLSDSVLEAERRGWVERAYKGLFPDLAPELTGSYDVVSMHHYLEHTREPRDELEAAHIALAEGGHLLVEVPDPDSRLGRALGWMWGPWFQPQHQQFVSLDNLVEALEAGGFTIVSAERGPAHQPIDLAFAMWLLVHRIAPARNRPWSPTPPTPGQRIGRAAAWTVFGPLMATALLVDHAVAPLVRRLPKGSNTYRVLARKDR